MSTFKISEFKYLVVNCGYTDRLLEHVPKIQEFLAEFDDGYYEGEDATSVRFRSDKNEIEFPGGGSRNIL